MGDGKGEGLDRVVGPALRLFNVPYRGPILPLKPLISPSRSSLFGAPIPQVGLFGEQDKG